MVVGRIPDETSQSHTLKKPLLEVPLGSCFKEFPAASVFASVLTSQRHLASKSVSGPHDLFSWDETFCLMETGFFKTNPLPLTPTTLLIC